MSQIHPSKPWSVTAANSESRGFVSNPESPKAANRQPCAIVMAPLFGVDLVQRSVKPSPKP